MKIVKSQRKTSRGRRARAHLRIRKRVIGTAERPRLMVRKTARHLYALVIDDAPTGGSRTITQVGTSRPGVATNKNYANIANAKKLGAEVGAALKEKGITTVVFDRGGFPYHGTVKALADAVREAGIKV